MKNSKEKTISRLASPLRLFFSLLLIIFGIEMIIMFLLPLFFSGVEGLAVNLADSTLLMLLAAPYLWMRIVRPLRNIALREAAWTRTILDNVVDGVVIFDNTGVVDSLNIAAEMIFGYTTATVKGLEMNYLFPEENGFFGCGGENRHNSHEAVGRRKDGSHFPVDLSISKVDEGDQCMFICIIRDISGRKQIEENIRTLNEDLAKKVEQLVEAQQELVRKEKLSILGQLSGSVGHELRNPLGVMSNAVYYLKMVLPDADQTVKEYLEIIQKEIGNSLQIITDLLDFTRTKSPQRMVVTAEKVVQQSLEHCTLPENVTITADLPDGLPGLNVDPLQTRQVLTNFITNAVQAMPDGGALRVATRQVSSYEFLVSEPETREQKQKTDFIAISVTDSGLGISPENMKKLFQPLFTTKARGIGLGLVVCKNLAEANGGRIEVESEPGKGTTFTVLLPAEKEQIWEKS